MKWQYRVCKETRTAKMGDKTFTDEFLSIREVYSEKKDVEQDGEWTYTAEPVSPYAAIDEGIDALRKCLERMTEALDKPVLDLDKK